MEVFAVCASKAVSSVLHSPFSDQSHLQFYGHGSSSLPSSKVCLNVPCWSLPSFAPKPVKAPLRALCDAADKAPMELTAEQALMKEISDLKLQMKQKKKELKSRMKDGKGTLKIQLKEGKKMKKQKDVHEGKVKMKCQSESSSSSSESSDEECVSVSMMMLRRGQSSVLQDARDNIEGGLGVAASVCTSHAIEVSGYSILSPGNDVMGSCTQESCRVSTLGKDITELNSSKVISGLEEVQKHGSTCGMMASSKKMSDSCFGFTSIAFPSLPMSNRIEVCAGAKCKKAGSEQLLFALQGQIPGSSNVEAVPCKCMGKCSMALNVRVHKEDTNPQHHSQVGVEDATLILGHHFGLGRPSTGLPSLGPKDGTRAPLPLLIV